MISMTRLALLAALALPGEALAARSDWEAADAAQMRLLLTADDGGDIAGGIELLLEPDWYTYWRNPGEAGIPPVFDFAGSENVEAVDILYPAPVRYDDGVSVSLIYRDEVVFPLAIRPGDAARPITLRVKATFGVCREVCIPTQAATEVTLPSEPDADPLAGARLEQFQARVPRPPRPGVLDIEAVAVVPDALLIDVRMPDSSYADLFAEPPAGWYIGQPAFVSRAGGVSRYRLSLTGRPKGSEALGQTFRFVAVAGGEAIEEAWTIR